MSDYKFNRMIDEVDETLNLHFLRNSANSETIAACPIYLTQVKSTQLFEYLVTT